MALRGACGGKGGYNLLDVFSVLRGGHSVLLFEKLYEIVDVKNAALLGDHLDLLVRVGENKRRRFHSLTVDVFGERLSTLFFERGGEIKPYFFAIKNLTMIIDANTS